MLKLNPRASKLIKHRSSAPSGPLPLSPSHTHIYSHRGNGYRWPSNAFATITCYLSLSTAVLVQKLYLSLLSTFVDSMFFLRPTSIDHFHLHLRPTSIGHFHLHLREWLIIIKVSYFSGVTDVYWNSHFILCLCSAEIRPFGHWHWWPGLRIEFGRSFRSWSDNLFLINALSLKFGLTSLH